LEITDINLAAVDDYYEISIIHLGAGTWTTQSSATAAFFMAEKLTGTT